MIEVLALHLLLVGLAMVEVIEVADDDGHRQCNGQHTGNGAQRAHDLAPDADRSARWFVVIIRFVGGREDRSNEEGCISKMALVWSAQGES